MKRSLQTHMHDALMILTYLWITRSKLTVLRHVTQNYVGVSACSRRLSQSLLCCTWCTSPSHTVVSPRYCMDYPELRYMIFLPFPQIITLLARLECCAALARNCEMWPQDFDNLDSNSAPVLWFAYNDDFAYFWHPAKCAQAVCGDWGSQEVQVLFGDRCLRNEILYTVRDHNNAQFAGI